MNKTGKSLVLIAGGAAGLMVGGAALPTVIFLLFCAVSWAGFTFETGAPGDVGGIVLAMMIGTVCIVIGATAGSAAGATVAQRILKRRSSLRRALLGAVLGLPLGAALLYPLYLLTHWGGGWWLMVAVVLTPCATVVTGGAVGSSWKARPADHP